MMVTDPFATPSCESVASACSPLGAPCLFPHIPFTSDHNRSNPPWVWQNLPTPLLAPEQRQPCLHTCVEGLACWMPSCTLEQRSLHLPLPVGFLLAKRHICRLCFLEVRLWDAGFVRRWLTEECSWDQHVWGSGGGKAGQRRKLKWEAVTARPQLILQGTGWPVVDLGCPRNGSRPWRGSFHCPGEEVPGEWPAAHTLSRAGGGGCLRPRGGVWGSDQPGSDHHRIPEPSRSRSQRRCMFASAEKTASMEWEEVPAKSELKRLWKRIRGTQRRYRETKTASWNEQDIASKIEKFRDFPGGPGVKSLPSGAGDENSIPGLGTKIPPGATGRLEN